MPLATIWRHPTLISDEEAISIRDVVELVTRVILNVGPGEVEVRVRDIGPLDINYMPISIEVDTGTGKDRWRIDKKEDICAGIAEQIFNANVLKPEWVGPDKSYVWIRICESSFVPIGHIEHSR
ncbi:MAG: hypothetical protein RLZZ234_108 [Candidatus Parcubacteria bacterium]|jgi:hypothetical protein